MNELIKSKIEIEQAISEIKSTISTLDECFMLDSLRIQEKELNSLSDKLEVELTNIKELTNISESEI